MTVTMRRTLAARSLLSVVLPTTFVALALAGCDNGPPAAARDPDPPLAVAPTETAEPEITPAALRERLGANRNAEILQSGGRIVHVNLFQQAGVDDLSPLVGLPLRFLDLTGTAVRDLSPLAGMPLEELYLEQTQVRDLQPLAGTPLRILRLEQTPVADISPLAGLPLEELNLYGTQVTDISSVQHMPLNTLWLTDTQVRDLRPLRGLRLESLDVHGTPVSDLSPLRGMLSLKRLEIAESQVTDLSPLAGLRLERLIFTPERIEKGIEIVRAMPTLQAIGTSFDTVKAADRFWQEQQ